MGNFENFKEELPCKEKFYSSLTDRKNSYKEYEHIRNAWSKFEMITIKDYNILLLASVFEQFRIIA